MKKFEEGKTYKASHYAIPGEYITMTVISRTEKTMVIRALEGMVRKRIYEDKWPGFECECCNTPRGFEPFKAINESEER